MAETSGIEPESYGRQPYIIPLYHESIIGLPYPNCTDTKWSTATCATITPKVVKVLL